MAFSASDAAFEGFQIIRREPVSVLAWGVFQLILVAVALPFMLPAMSAFTAANLQSGAQPPTRMLQAMGAIYLIVIPLALLTYSVAICAVYRCVLRPGERGFARLALGGDELRMALLMILLGLLYAAVSLGVVVVGALLAAGLAIIGGKGQGAVIAGVMMTILILAFMLAAVWGWVRLSLALPMTFAQRRLRLWSSWRLTRGRFWPLFGCYLLAFVLMMMISLLAFIIYGVIGVVGAGGSLTGAAEILFRPDASSLKAYLTPARVVYTIVSAFVGAASWAVGFAPSAVAYRELTGGGPEGQAEAFD